MRVRILREYERASSCRSADSLAPSSIPAGTGRARAAPPDPLVDKMVQDHLRTITMDVAPQDVITKDNVSSRSRRHLLRVLDANKRHRRGGLPLATSQMAQTTLRSLLGQQELDDLLSRVRRSMSS